MRGSSTISALLVEQAKQEANGIARQSVCRTPPSLGHHETGTSSGVQPRDDDDGEGEHGCIIWRPVSTETLQLIHHRVSREGLQVIQDAKDLAGVLLAIRIGVLCGFDDRRKYADADNNIIEMDTGGEEGTKSSYSPSGVDTEDEQETKTSEIGSCREMASDCRVVTIDTTQVLQEAQELAQDLYKIGRGALSRYGFESRLKTNQNNYEQYVPAVVYSLVKRRQRDHEREQNNKMSQTSSILASCSEGVPTCGQEVKPEDENEAMRGSSCTRTAQAMEEAKELALDLFNLSSDAIHRFDCQRTFSALPERLGAAIRTSYKNMNSGSIMAVSNGNGDRATLVFSLLDRPQEQEHNQKNDMVTNRPSIYNIPAQGGKAKMEEDVENQGCSHSTKLSNSVLGEQYSSLPCVLSPKPSEMRDKTNNEIIGNGKKSETGDLMKRNVLLVTCRADNVEMLLGDPKPNDALDILHVLTCDECIELLQIDQHRSPEQEHSADEDMNTADSFFSGKQSSSLVSSAYKSDSAANSANNNSSTHSITRTSENSAGSPGPQPEEVVSPSKLHTTDSRVSVYHMGPKGISKPASLGDLGSQPGSHDDNEEGVEVLLLRALGEGRKTLIDAKEDSTVPSSKCDLTQQLRQRKCRSYPGYLPTPHPEMVQVQIHSILKTSTSCGSSSSFVSESGENIVKKIDQHDDDDSNVESNGTQTTTTTTTEDCSSSCDEDMESFEDYYDVVSPSPSNVLSNASDSISANNLDYFLSLLSNPRERMHLLQL